eukprot:1136446-Pelagomonas_calceolata.AAC.1
MSIGRNFNSDLFRDEKKTDDLHGHRFNTPCITEKGYGLWTNVCDSIEVGLSSRGRPTIVRIQAVLLLPTWCCTIHSTAPLTAQQSSTLTDAFFGENILQTYLKRTFAHFSSGFTTAHRTALWMRAFQFPQARFEDVIRLQKFCDYRPQYFRSAALVGGYSDVSLPICRSHHSTSKVEDFSVCLAQSSRPSSLITQLKVKSPGHCNLITFQRSPLFHMKLQSINTPLIAAQLCIG